MVQDHEHPLLMSDAFDIGEVRWLAPLVRREFDCAVKTRYRQGDLACRVHLHGADRAQVALRHPARAVTPGQYAVFYDGDVCLGGGVIAARRNSSSAASRGGRLVSSNSLFSLEGS